VVSVRVLVGDALTVLKTLPSESVQLVCTSPPYFGLRSYSTAPQVWGGDPDCLHQWGAPQRTPWANEVSGPSENVGKNAAVRTRLKETGPFCLHCPAWRGELGSEPTPALFIEHLLTIFDEVHRVLRKDGLVFCNLGDSYSGSGKGPSGHNGIGDQARRQGFTGMRVTDNSTHQGKPAGRFRTGKAYIESGNRGNAVPGIPAKNLLLVPQRFAIGMQERGWIVRSEIAWCKTSAMPESVRDRPSSAWEPIWMFSKSQRYFYDGDAVRQQLSDPERKADRYPRTNNHNPDRGTRFGVLGGYTVPASGGASLRNFWLLGPEPSNLNHYASYPTALVKRCILAGTSERGACSVCGAPWRRVVERTGAFTEKSNHQPAPNKGRLEAFGERAANMTGDGFVPNRRAITRDLGWRPGCSHYDALYRLMPQARRARRRQQQDRSGLWWRRVRKRPGGTDWSTVPCAVLDPFLGSGTTALVADRLGRDATGIELSEEYAEMARKRIANDAGPMFDDVTVEAPRQASLFDEVAG
jgi:DNA modification methylase